MLTFLFWNLGMNRKSVQTSQAFQSLLLASAARLVEQWQVDVLVLAEYMLEPQHMVSVLNDKEPGRFAHSRSNQSKLAIFYRTKSTNLSSGREGTRFTTRHVIPQQGETLLLVAVHMLKKGEYSAQSQETEALFISSDIIQEENGAAHRRTLMVGDFNMNPFEYGMIGAGHFHGVMTRALAEQRQRTLQDRQHFFFYNPMWSFLGDASSEPPGTYYDWRSEANCYFWNLFDQVLLRPGRPRPLRSAAWMRREQAGRPSCWKGGAMSPAPCPARNTRSGKKAEVRVELTPAILFAFQLAPILWFCSVRQRFRGKVAQVRPAGLKTESRR
jgi:hypothetical protein